MESMHVAGSTCGTKKASSCPSQGSHVLPLKVHPSCYSPAPTIESNPNKASKHIVLTPQVIHRHDVHQKHLHNQGELYAAQQQHKDMLQAAAETLGIHLPSGLYSDVKEKFGMTPMEHFEASSSYSYHHYNRYSIEVEPLNDNTNFRINTLHAPLTTSSLRLEDQYERTFQDSSTYAAEASPPDTANSVLEQSNYLRTSEHDQYVAGWESDLAGIGAQFDSYPKMHCTQPLYYNDDVIEE